MLRNVTQYFINIFPTKLRRRLFHPMIVPNIYREEIALAESVLLMKCAGTNLDDEYWSSMLRKYCHIIDKGLQRYDCEAGHSYDYYLLACEALLKINDTIILNDPSITWARNIINKFEKLQQNDCIGTNRTSFVSTRCTYEDLVDLIQTRRSVRMFSERSVPRSDIEKIVSAINWAPSSCNRQTAKIFIADTTSIVQKCIGVNAGATCLSDSVPCFLSFCADIRPYEMPQEMTLPILDTALGIQNCCLVAHSLGIGMTILNWTHHTDEQDKILREVLAIPSYYRIVANAVLGYPAHGAPLPVKKSENLTYTFVQDKILR